MSKTNHADFKVCSEWCCPVAWFVFYKDDGQLAQIVHTLAEARRYSTMAYDVYEVKPGDRV